MHIFKNHTSVTIKEKDAHTSMILGILFPSPISYSNMLHGIRLIIYDLDGVLINSNPAIRESITYAIKQHNLQYDIEKIMKQMGTPLNKILKDVLQEKDQTKIPEILAQYKKYYSEKGKDKLKLQDNVLETFGYFNENSIEQCIASNSSRDLMQPILTQLGLMNYIKFFIGLGDVEHPKPNPMSITRAMDMAKVEKNETVFIDDSSTGLTAGKAAGVNTVGIATGVHTTSQLMSVDPDFILTNIAQLREIISV